MAPEEVHELKSYVPKPGYNQHKADVFQTGMTLLLSATLSSGSSIYKWENNDISEKEIRRSLQSITSRYSPTLVDIISRMLITDPMLRPGFADFTQ